MPVIHENRCPRGRYGETSIRRKLIKNNIITLYTDAHLICKRTSVYYYRIQMYRNNDNIITTVVLHVSHVII